MGPVNWLAVALSALLMLGLWLIWPGKPALRRGPVLLAAVVLLALPAAMIGHALARIGADRLALKPWLYWMQTGGITLAFVIPALWLARLRTGWDWRGALGEAAYWLAAFLLMGTVFWVLA